MSTNIPAPVSVVWADISDLASHVEWMADAESIQFTSDQRTGVGTTFNCATRVGPLHTTDRMEVVEWEDGCVIGVRHIGLVTGTGRFVLEPDGRHTRFTWDEHLRIPWTCLVDPGLVGTATMLGATFHPELTADPTVHDSFLAMCRTHRESV